jgi:undecaprenyl-phosphate 4-deoxy-4-formamido-L-arabinose transferase
MNCASSSPEFSFIVPLYQTRAGTQALLAAFRSLSLEESWELVLVDDGSMDDTFDQAQRHSLDFPAPVILVELARNFGEHAAVLEGCRHARGRFLVTLDDDLQNPVEEAVRLLRHLRESGAEVAYSRYAKKRHSLFRNLGSRVVNLAAAALIDKPSGLYLSSFRALHRDLVERITSYRGPYPYMDGLILGATQRITTLEVRHEARCQGTSGYTLKKLLRLALSVLFDFSIRPLRIASVLGLLLCAAGLLTLAAVLVEILLYGTRQVGWGSLMAMLAIFSGAHLLILGIIGEYVGRIFLIVSGKPQSLVRMCLEQRREATGAA